MRLPGKRISIKCAICETDFSLLESVKRAREKNGKIIKYCSPECAAKGIEKKKPVNCLQCGNVFKTTRNKFCSAICSRDYQKINGTQKKNGFWYENGYKVLYTENGKGIKEHVKIMQDHIGRKLKINEVVHHINQIKTDNRLENLQLMTRGEHSKLHRELEMASGKKLF